MKTEKQAKLDARCASVKKHLSKSGVQFRGDEPCDPALQCARCARITRHEFKRHQHRTVPTENKTPTLIHQMIYACRFCGDERAWGNF
jgi:hypothetical protein